MISPEQIDKHWLTQFRAADDLDPVIREALRPVYDRLKADAPDAAAAFALALICRALRSLNATPGINVKDMRMHVAQLCAAYVAVNPDHPTE